ncbi:DEAD/DEAH box helicase, partial [Lactococcus garvieae]
MDKKTVESINLSSFDDNFKLTKYVSSIIDTTEGREILIDILDKFDEVNIQAKIIWNDLLERAGFYPYFENDETSLSQEMRANYHHSFNLSNITFHLEQKEIQEELEDGKNVLVSAPTSFGKSLLIEEIVASGKYKNIIIIQPTLALIDETRRKLSKYNS